MLIYLWTQNTRVIDSFVNTQYTRLLIHLFVNTKYARLLSHLFVNTKNTRYWFICEHTVHSFVDSFICEHTVHAFIDSFICEHTVHAFIDLFICEHTERAFIDSFIFNSLLRSYLRLIFIMHTGRGNNWITNWKHMGTEFVHSPFYFMFNDCFNFHCFLPFEVHSASAFLWWWCLVVKVKVNGKSDLHDFPR